jgi:hypothetical protein
MEQNMIDAVRDRLLAMRDEEVARILRQNPSPALAVITELLPALDELPHDAQSASRAVVSDNGQEIRLTLYSEIGAVASMEVDPICAVAIAGQLIQAALQRLSS